MLVNKYSLKIMYRSLNHRDTAPRMHLSEHKKMIHLRTEEIPHHKPKRKEIVGKKKREMKRFHPVTHTKWKQC
jgi:hypothetical protein